MKNFIFDIETLAVKPRSAVILSIGAVCFDYEHPKTFEELTKSGFYVKCDVREQLAAGGKTEEDTMAWWKKQSDEAKKVLSPCIADRKMFQALAALNQWLTFHNKYDFEKDLIWSRGAAFDFPKIEYQCDNNGGTPNLNYWKVRDIRTFVDTLAGSTSGTFPIDESLLPGFVYHDPLHDAAKDAVIMQFLHQQLFGDQ